MECHRQILTFLLLVLTLALFSCNAKVLHIKHAPSYFVFQDSSKTNLASSNLPAELASALGVRNQQSSGAFRSKSVLKRPAANFLLTLLTSEGHDVPMKSMTSFPLEWDMPFVDVDQLVNSVQSKFLSQEPLAFNLFSHQQFTTDKSNHPIFSSVPSTLSFAKERLLSDDSVVSVHPSLHINASLESDSQLLGELQTVQDVVSTLKNNPDSLQTKTPDLLSFTLSGLKAIADAHGIGSEQTREAEKLVAATVDKLTEELKAVYGGNVLVEVVVAPDTNKQGLVRHARSLMAAAEKPKPVDVRTLNLALDYYQDFPVTFNIVLWLSLILIIFIIFVSYGIWNMNPNLESILYRVPQDDIKKMQ